MRAVEEKLDRLSVTVEETRSRVVGKRGVTTEADWVNALKQQGLLVAGDAESPFNKKLRSCAWDGWFRSLDALPAFPDLGTGEHPPDKSPGTQDYVSNILSDFNATISHDQKVKIHNWRAQRNGFVQAHKRAAIYHNPDPTAFSHRSYATRKPDVVCYVGNSRGSLGISIIGDVKGRSGDGDFPDDAIGHVLDLAEDLMRVSQPARMILYFFLTDAYRFQFFSIFRERDGSFKYEQSVVSHGIIGWQVFIAFTMYFKYLGSDVSVSFPVLDLFWIINDTCGRVGLYNTLNR
jgi:hypothetical protein